MKLPSSRLYWRMTLYIGAAILAFVMLGVSSLALVASRELQDYVAAREGTLAREASRVLAADGLPGLQRWIAAGGRVPEDVAVYVLDESGRNVLGPPLPERYQRFVRRFVLGTVEPAGSGYRPIRLAPLLLAPDGREYAFLLLPRGIELWGSPATLAALLAAAVLVVAIVAWLIARAFTRPLGALQFAVRELASGRVGARAPPGLAARSDELGALARDFDAMAARIEQLLAGRQQLMRDMSHELRSPIARLQAAVALADQKQPLPAQERARIDAELVLVDRAIGEMLRYSRLEAAPALERRLVRLDALLEDLARDEEVEARARGCRIELRLAPGLAVVGDTTLLRSALENAVRNAIRFSPPGAAIELAAREAPVGSAEITVLDRGPGVPAGWLERIFEPYARAPQGETESTGSGLGLAIARRVFEAHGGRIAAAPRPGGGLAIHASLPLAETH